MNIEISPRDYDKKLNWYDAMLYCSMIEIDGKTDWRLPTLEELSVIYTIENNFWQSYYWTSTDADDTDKAWMLFLSHAQRFEVEKTFYGNHARPVRTIT